MNMTGSKTSGSFSGVAVPAAAREPESPELALARSLLSSRKLLRKAEMLGGWGRDGEVAAEDEEEKDGEPPGAVVAAGKELDAKGNGKGMGMTVGAGTLTSSRKSPRHSGQESSPAAAAEATRRTVRLHW
jgi:hypothetical protein